MQRVTIYGDPREPRRARRARAHRFEPRCRVVARRRRKRRRLRSARVVRHRHQRAGELLRLDRPGIDVFRHLPAHHRAGHRARAGARARRTRIRAARGRRGRFARRHAGAAVGARLSRARRRTPSSSARTITTPPWGSRSMRYSANVSSSTRGAGCARRESSRRSPTRAKRCCANATTGGAIATASTASTSRATSIVKPACSSARMDAATYATLTHAMDSFDVRDAGAAPPNAPRLHFVGISSDWLFRAH